MKTARQAPTIVAPSIWPDTMGLEDASDYLRLGRDATRTLFDQGLLPGVSLNQKHLVFRRTALDAFLAKLELEQQTERLRGKVPPPANDDQGGRHARRKSKRPQLPDLGRYEGT